MNTRYSIFILLIVTSCSLLKVDQKIIFQRKDDIGLSNLVLNTNGRFYYSFDPLTIFQETEGSYKIVKNNIYLRPLQELFLQRSTTLEKNLTRSKLLFMRT